MVPIINFIPIIFILLQTDASVILHEEGEDVGDGFFECGEQLLLSCKIDAYSISMTWQNDSSVVPLAECLLNNCTLEATVQNKFLFTYDTSTGIFDLIFNVSLYNNGTTYTCSDGSTTANSLVLTKDYKPTLSYTDGKLKAVCGCIDEHVNVTFKLIVEGMSGTFGQPFEHANVVTDYNSSCLLDTECGAPNSIQKYATIEAELDDEGYHIQVEVTYDDKISVKSLRTNETYKIVCVNDGRICIYLIVMITFWILDVILIVILAIAFCCHWFWKPVKDREIYLHVTCLAVIVAAVQILISFIVFVIYFPPCYHDCCPCCMKFKLGGWVFLSYFVTRSIVGVIVVLYICCCCKGYHKDFFKTYIKMAVTELAFLLFVLPPIVNAIITLLCWIKADRKLFVKSCIDKTESAGKEILPEMNQRAKERILQEKRQEVNIKLSNLKNNDQGENPNSVLPHLEDHKKSGPKLSPNDHAQIDALISETSQKGVKAETKPKNNRSGSPKSLASLTNVNITELQKERQPVTKTNMTRGLSANFTDQQYEECISNN